MRLKRIAVGVDFSPESQRALQHAQKLALREEAELLLLHVSPGVSPSLGGEIARRYRSLTREQLVAVHQALERLSSACRESGVLAREEVAEGDPETALAAAARERGADLIVVGTHGRTGLRRFLLGSVAERTVRLADAAVLVARGPAPDERGYGRVLVPTDFSRTAERALERAFRLARREGRIDVVHFWDLPVPAGSDMSGTAVMEPLERDARAEALRSGHELAERFRGRGVEITFQERMRPPTHGIQELLEEVSYDLVAMGSHGHQGLRRWLLGSVAELTVRHAPGAVLVVKDAGARRETQRSMGT